MQSFLKMCLCHFNLLLCSIQFLCEILCLLCSPTHLPQVRCSGALSETSQGDRPHFAPVAGSLCISSIFAYHSSLVFSGFNCRFSVSWSSVASFADFLSAGGQWLHLQIFCQLAMGNHHQQKQLRGYQGPTRNTDERRLKQRFSE